MKISIPSDVQAVLTTLEQHHYQAYLIGGCVRDSLLSRPIHDWDICTNASPETIAAIFPKTIPTGVRFGTITVVSGAYFVEITTFRAEGEYDNHRRPTAIRQAQTLLEDVSRRDFTINAIAADFQGNIIDLLNGKEDIQNKVIRCVGDPYVRFREDPLRILRAMRFSAVLGFEIEAETFDEMVRTAPLILQCVSKERIQAELRKMVVGENIRSVLLKCAPILSQIIPQFAPCIGFEQHSLWHQYDVYTHIATAVSLSEPNEVLRLALLFHDIGKPNCFTMDADGYGHFPGHGAESAKITDAIMKEFRFDNATRNRVVKLIQYHDLRLEATPKCVRKWIAKFGVDDFQFFLQIRKADILAQSDYQVKPRLEKLEKLSEIYHSLLNEPVVMTVRDLAVNGYDLMSMGFRGKEIGEELNRLLQLVLEEKAPNQKEALLANVSNT